jgi:hypothetical protein
MLQNKIKASYACVLFFKWVVVLLSKEESEKRKKRQKPCQEKNANNFKKFYAFECAE